MESERQPQRSSSAVRLPQTSAGAVSPVGASRRPNSAAARGAFDFLTLSRELELAFALEAALEVRRAALAAPPTARLRPLEREMWDSLCVSRGEPRRGHALASVAPPLPAGVLAFYALGAIVAARDALDQHRRIARV